MKEWILRDYAMQTWKAYLPDEASTAALGAALARVLQPGLVLHLHGELGAGKTSPVSANTITNSNA